MKACVCNNLSDGRVRDVLDLRPTISNAREVFMACGIKPRRGCGQCVERFEELIAESKAPKAGAPEGYKAA